MELGNGWFVSAASTSWRRMARAAGTPNPDYWTFEPTFGVSYLGNNWVASANFFYDINTTSTGTSRLRGTLSNLHQRQSVLR